MKHSSTTALAVFAFLALALVLAPAAGAASKPVLGAAAFAPNGSGWGTAEPAEIFNGGDPSGLVTGIRWQSWGDEQARGWGRNPIFKPHGGYYRKPVRIQLLATGLGKCGARAAYTRLSFREPKRPSGPLGPWHLWSGASSLCHDPYG